MGFNTGDRLKRLREYYFQWSRYRLSANSGVDAKYIKKIEENISRPSVDEIEKICNGFDIPLSLFFILTSNDYAEYEIQKLKIEKILTGFDFRYNTKNIYPKCYKSIWYSGYICSAFYDEVEIKVHADGNVRATVYSENEEVLSLNGSDVGDDLIKYVRSDDELEKMAIWGDFDEKELRSHAGRAVFISECNWLCAQVYNHETRECSEWEVLDNDDIFGFFKLDANDLLRYIYESGVY